MLGAAAQVINTKACFLSQGRVFLDRDPKHFRLILNYLRDGEVCLPACPLELQEILQEALFYQVCGLVAYYDTPSSLPALWQQLLGQTKQCLCAAGWT